MKGYIILALGFLLGLSIAHDDLDDFGIDFKCDRKKADIVIGIESSELVSETEFHAMKKAVKKLMCRLDKATTIPDQLRFAVFSFADEVNNKDSVVFRASTEKKQLKADVNNLKHDGTEKPNLLAPLAFANKFLDDGLRNDTERIYVYVGTGRSSVDVYSDAFAAARRHAIYASQENFVIHVGDQTKATMENLRRISGFRDQESPLGHEHFDTFEQMLSRIYWHCRPCFQPKIDMTILMDNSLYDEAYHWGGASPPGNYGQNKYVRMKKVIKNFIDRLEIGPRSTRIAIVSFGPEIYEKTSFGFNQHTTNTTLLQAIDDLTQTPSTGLNMTKAWEYATNTVFAHGHARKDVEKMIIAFTEHPQRDEVVASGAAAAARASGIQTFVVGFSNYELNYRDVAGDHFHVYDGRGVLQENSYQLGQLPWMLGQKTCISAVFAPLN